MQNADIKQDAVYNAKPEEPGLREVFLEACKTDLRRALSCARPNPSREDVMPRPKGVQRFVVSDTVVRTQYASQVRYYLMVGSLALDIFVQVVRFVLSATGAKFSLEYEGERVSAYNIIFA